MEETKIKPETAELAFQKGFDNRALIDKFFGIKNNICSQSVLRKWLQEKHKIYIELIIDGWKDDNCVSEEFICYRAFIWQIGKPRPKPAEDLGASNYDVILESALQSALDLI